MNRIVKHLFGLLCVAAFCLSHAQASFVVYTSRAAFNAATTNQSIIDFEGITSSYVYYGSTTGSSFAGVTFTDPNARLFVIDPSIYTTTGVSDYLNMNDTGSTTVTAAFTNPSTYAVGLDIGCLFNWGNVANPGNVQITLSSGGTFTATVPFNIAGTSQSLGFIGIVSDTAFSSLNFYDPSQGLMIDNFTLANPVPAPPALVLFGIGLFCVPTLRKKFGQRIAVVA